MKDLRRTECLLQNSHGDVKYSVGDVVNNIVITMYGARWVLKILGGALREAYGYQIHINNCLTGQ